MIDLVSRPGRLPWLRRALLSRPVPWFSPAPRQRLTVTLYAYSFLDEFILFYPVYALLFSDTGLSIVEISTLFAFWSVTAVVLEVPSGILADAFSRRLLLVTGPLFAAAAFTLWVATPSYWAFALGFVLWGVRGALGSGALEALVYEELDRVGAAGVYATVMGRARTFGLGAMLTAIAVAGPAFAYGGYPLVAAASVLACLLCAVVALAFPEHRGGVNGVNGVNGSHGADETHGVDSTHGVDGSQDVDGLEPELGYLATLRAGLREVRANRLVLRAMLFVPAVDAVWGAIEEYVPLLARETSASPALVTLLVLVVAVGIAAGGLIAGLGRRMRPPVFAGAVALAALALAGGALLDRPVGFIAVAAAFCVLQVASVVADARLQERITGPSRATVTSLAGLGTEIATLLVFAGYAAVSTWGGHHLAFAIFAVPYLGLAVLLARDWFGWRPNGSVEARPAARQSPKKIFI